MGNQGEITGATGVLEQGGGSSGLPYSSLTAYYAP